MNNDLWYVLVQHWDEDCCDYSEVDFFTSAKVAVDYATKISNEFRSSYEADHYEIKETSGGGCGWRLETYTEINVTYPNSEDAVACELYKIGKVIPTSEVWKFNSTAKKNSSTAKSKSYHRRNCQRCLMPLTVIAAFTCRWNLTESILFSLPATTAPETHGWKSSTAQKTP